MENLSLPELRTCENIAREPSRVRTFPMPTRLPVITVSSFTFYLTVSC
jgi:hypothetical protein